MTWKICPNCWQSNAAELASCRRCGASLEEVLVASKLAVPDRPNTTAPSAPATATKQHSYTNEELAEMLFQATSEIRQLKRELQSLKKSLPNSMILDRNLLKRALAIYGHMMLISVILSVLFFCFAQLLPF